MKFYWPTEISALLKENKKVSSKEISQRKKFVLIHYYNDVLTYKTGKKEKELIKSFLIKKIDKTLNIIKGTVVSAGYGIIKGKVKLLLTPRNANKINKGDILVAPMTSPDYIIAIKKASAIITDHGGMTCHAAIVSRELGIPCIVGTKIATKILKDNDLIEVDADKGVVRKVI